MSIVFRLESFPHNHYITNMFYNTPRACLLNRSPVPAMVLKSNRSGYLYVNQSDKTTWRILTNQIQILLFVSGAKIQREELCLHDHSTGRIFQRGHSTGNSIHMYAHITQWNNKKHEADKEFTYFRDKMSVRFSYSTITKFAAGPVTRSCRTVRNSFSRNVHDFISWNTSFDSLILAFMLYSTFWHE